LQEGEKLQHVISGGAPSRISIGAITLMVAAGAGGYWLANGMRPTHRAPIHGRFSRETVERAARRLCPHIQPDIEIRAVEVEPLYAYHTHQAPQLLWCASCSDGGRADFYFRWSDETGKLVWASSNARRPKPSRPRITSQEAVRAGIDWLRKAGLSSGGCNWQLYGAPYYNEEAWIMLFRTKTENAIVNVDASDGSLQTLDLRQ
jgi:hypothetical protein